MINNVDNEISNAERQKSEVEVENFSVRIKK